MSFCLKSLFKIFVRVIINFQRGRIIVNLVFSSLMVRLIILAAFWSETYILTTECLVYPMMSISLTKACNWVVLCFFCLFSVWSFLQPSAELNLIADTGGNFYSSYKTLNVVLVGLIYFWRILNSNIAFGGFLC